MCKMSVFKNVFLSLGLSTLYGVLSLNIILENSILESVCFWQVNIEPFPFGQILNCRHIKFLLVLKSNLYLIVFGE